MRKLFLLVCALSGLASAAPAASSASVPGLDAIYPELDAFYIDLHQSPELSGHEEKTSAKLADRLRRLGYEVTTGVGGTGVVALMKNGSGPTLMLREDMDALPVEEKTGLPYASKVTVKRQATVMLIGKPAEETNKGAEAMRKDGLFTRFPKPTFAVALHDSAEVPSD